MDKLQLITTRIALDYNDKNFSLNEIDYDALEAELGNDVTLNRRPILMKYDDGHLIVTFSVTESKGGIGFGS